MAWESTTSDEDWRKQRDEEEAVATGRPVHQGGAPASLN